ncbi:MAG TPA: response regulator [Burkholderiales bacterium]|jgi:CheY-like chemotaxis protein
MRTVLVADDDPTLRGALKLGLEGAGYQVRLARNGAEAFALQQKNPCDVLVTDIFMPDCDGFEAIDRIRKLSPRTKIIAMSGDAKRVKGEVLSAAALVGADATLKKPFQLDRLIQLLHEVAGPR